LLLLLLLLLLLPLLLLLLLLLQLQLQLHLHLHLLFFLSIPSKARNLLSPVLAVVFFTSPQIRHPEHQSQPSGTCLAFSRPSTIRYPKASALGLIVPPKTGL
jgi:hypothetical protein